MSKDSDLLRLRHLYESGVISRDEYRRSVLQLRDGPLYPGGSAYRSLAEPPRTERTPVETHSLRNTLLAIGGGLLALFLLIALCSVTWVSVDSSHATLVYNDGLLDDRSFDQMVAPGSSKTPVGISQNSFEVPTGVRQWRASNDEGSGADYKGTIPVTVRGVAMGFEPTILFKLNLANMPESSKPWVADFYEKHLRQFGATDWDSNSPDSKWVAFLNTRIYPVVKQVMQATITSMDPVALRFDQEGARSKLADDLGPAIEAEIADQLGGPYLVDMSVQLSQPEVDAAVAEMLGAPQKAKVEADNQINAAKEITRQAEGTAAEAEAQVAAAQRQAAADNAKASAAAAPLAANAANNVAPCRLLNPAMSGLDCALLLQSIRGQQPLPALGGSLVAP